MSSILGHSHPEIVECVSQNVASLDHLLSNMLSEPVADLAELLTSLTPDPLDKTFFLNTGSETTEAAIKIAKCATQKFEIVAFAASYRKLLGCIAPSPCPPGCLLARCKKTIGRWRGGWSHEACLLSSVHPLNASVSFHFIVSLHRWSDWCCWSGNLHDRQEGWRSDHAWLHRLPLTERHHLALPQAGWELRLGDRDGFRV